MEPQQGADYERLLAVARVTEELGFDGFFRSDHYLWMAAMVGDGLPGPTDAWVTLAGLARETTRLRLGTLVTSATFRLPGPLAISVAQVDAMSGGRIELGLGAGWFDDEHRAYGIPFPPMKERFDRLEEQLEILTGLWTTPVDDRFSYDGRHYTVADSPALPKPTQSPHPPVIIGGMFPHAARRALRYGDGWIPHSRRPQYEDVTDFLPQFRQMAAEAGRDLATCPVTVWGVQPDIDRVRRYADQGVARGVAQLTADKADQILPLLDRWAEIIAKL